MTKQKTKYALLIVSALLIQACSNRSVQPSEVSDKKVRGVLSNDLTKVLTSNGQVTIPPYNPNGPTPPGVGPRGYFPKPCPSRTGAAHPDQGSGLCTGNLYTEIPLATTGVSLVHNSLSSEMQFGVGRGFSLSIDARFFLFGTQAILRDGDGSLANFHKVNTNSYVSDDLRVDTSTFNKSGDSFIQTHPDGTSITFARLEDAQYVAIKVTDRNGLITTITRDAYGFIKELADPFGNKVKFMYAGSGASQQLAFVDDRAGNRYTLTNMRGRLTAIRQPGETNPSDGKAWKFEYGDGSGRISSRTSADGEVLKYTYYISGELESIENSLGYLTVVYYSGSSVRTQSSFDKDTETFNSSGQILSSTSKAGTTRFVRDSAGRVKNSTDQLGRVTTFSYDATNDALVSKIEHSHGGGVTDIFRNSARRTTRVLFVLGQIKRMTNYDPGKFGVVTSVVSGPAGQDGMSFTYDAKGNLYETKKNGRLVKKYTYFSNGLIKSATNALGLTRSYTYDARGYLASDTDHLGRQTTYANDAFGNVTQTLTPTMKYTQQYTRMGAALGTSSVSSKSGGGDRIENTTAASYFSNGAPNTFNLSTKVSGRKINELEIRYETPEIPGRRSSSILTNERGETYDLDR